MARVAELPVDEIVSVVEAHALADEPRLLVSSSSGRVGVFAIADDNITLLVDAIPDGDVLGELAAALTPARIGRWDATPSTRWKHAWTVGTKAWVLWSRRNGRSFWLQDGAIHRSGPRPPLPSKSIAAVQTYASEGWYEQGAEVRLEDETTIEIAETTNWAARLDPAYDYHQLVADLTWAESLCKDLATVLGVPVGERIPDRAQ